MKALVVKNSPVAVILSTTLTEPSVKHRYSLEAVDIKSINIGGTIDVSIGEGEKVRVDQLRLTCTEGKDYFFPRSVTKVYLGGTEVPLQDTFAIDFMLKHYVYNESTSK